MWTCPACGYENRPHMNEAPLVYCVGCGFDGDPDEYLEQHGSAEDDRADHAYALSRE